ncbi:DNA cytosine methyltransferase [Sphingomonas sp. NFR15]|uniref:DNA cytosine methyltransferase n=1 Tax=Sphingomonas sp. NFR15 TaxID=1566282 RepID=UPI00087F6BBE|nr:DNA cytosine methyltransferase [Sphingomonas sp. NFR15]SDA14705.1 DNA (cytosine-5)-methyltransferase 1 [Sphingomonas sp. NFR15]
MAALTGFVASAALAFTPIYDDGLFIDGFAGGGGASTGIEQAIGRSVDIAINHSPTAIAIHKANHPETEHHCQDIKAAWPLAVTRMRRVAGAWFSPDCKEFSKAKGGPVKDRSIRALCWEVVAWLKDVRPTCGYLENVEEFEYAAPLDSNGVPIAGQEGREFKRFVKAIRALGYRVQWRLLKACDYGAPTSRKRLYMVMRCDGLPIVWPKPTYGAPGSTGVRSGKLLPYRTAAECIDWTIACPSIFDRVRELADATKRRIAHGVMRYVVNAAEPFIVPVTHTQSSPRTNAVSKPLPTITTANGGEFAAVDVTVAPHITKFRTGSVGSDMGAPMPTVTANGEPARPAGASPLGMVEALLAPHVMTNRNAAKPFTAGNEPTHTITAGGAHQNAVAASLAPIIVNTANSKTTGRGPNAWSAEEPTRTQTTASSFANVTAFLSSFYGSDKANGGGEAHQPAKTIRAGGQHHAVVTAHLEQANGGPRNRNSAGRDARRPLSTATTTGSQQRIVQTTMVEEGDLPSEMMDRAVKVAAFLVKYYATDGENEGAQIQPVDRPLGTITTKARFAVVTVTIDAKTYVIVDIGLRMLKPRELANAQGFPPDYVLDPIVRKFLRGKWVERRLTIAEQINAIGNSVCPPVARALVAANQPRARQRMAA